MFATHPIYKSPMSDFLANAEETHWMAVRLLLQQVWFLADVTHTETAKTGKVERTSRQTLLVTSVDDLECVEGSMSVGDEGAMVKARIDAVFIITPSYENESGGWKMDRLAAVWTAKEPREMTQALIYETCEGPVYCSTAFDTPCEKLVDRKLRVRFAKAVGSTALA
jgi:hypothetical protein